MLTGLWSFLFAWYNLPFTVLLALCFVLAVLQLIGLGGDDDSGGGGHDMDHDVDLDHDIDLDHDLDVDHDVDLDHDLDADHDIDHDADADHSVEGSSSSPLAWLAFVGAGKAPLMVVFLILFGSIGLLGWMFNALVQGLLGVYVGIAFAAVLPLSVVLGALTSSRITRLIGRALPPVVSTATSKHNFVGRTGTVISPFVDHKYGMVHLRDQGGTLISVFAVTDNEEPVNRGEEVVLVSYQEHERCFIVTRAKYPNPPPGQP